MITKNKFSNPNGFSLLEKSLEEGEINEWIGIGMATRAQASAAPIVSTAALRLSIIKFTGPTRMPRRERSHEFIHLKTVFTAPPLPRYASFAFVACLSAQTRYRTWRLEDKC
jgi:hypothetical protein